MVGSLDTDSIKAFVLKYLSDNFEDWLVRAMSSARIGGSIVLALIGNAVLVPVVLFYLLIDWPELVRRVHELVPPRLRPTVKGFLDECDAVLGQYLRGQLLVMLILAGFYSLGLALFGFDLAVPVGVFTGSRSSFRISDSESGSRSRCSRVCCSSPAGTV